MHASAQCAWNWARRVGAAGDQVTDVVSRRMFLLLPKYKPRFLISVPNEVVDNYHRHSMHPISVKRCYIPILLNY